MSLPTLESIKRVYGNVYFFDLLQDPAIIIDSDIIGAYKLICTARAATHGLMRFTEVMKFKLDVTEQKAEDAIRHFMLENGFLATIQNLYINEARGLLFSGKYNQEYDMPEAFIEISSFSASEPFFEVNVTGLMQYKPLVEKLTEYFKENGFSFNPTRISIATAVNDDMRMTDGVIDPHRYGRPEFYPFIEHDLNEYVDAFMEDDASVLIFYGPPGTGKSTLIRTILGMSKAKAMISYSEKLVMSGNLVDRALSDNYQILAIEDADTMIISREKGNDIMAALLNTADGICRTNLKLIISTNLSSTSKMDSALLRPGRCFDIVEFRELNEEEARNAADSLGITFIDDERTDRKWSLSEVTSMGKKVSTLYSKKRRPASIGFGG
jgi:hypothetical protein